MYCSVQSPLKQFKCTSAVWFQTLSTEATERKPKTLRRKKREWILPPAKLMENTDYTNRKFIAKVLWFLLIKILFPTVSIWLHHNVLSKLSFKVLKNVKQRTGFCQRKTSQHLLKRIRHIQSYAAPL